MGIFNHSIRAKSLVLNTNTGGFTLIELLIVVGIIGILLAVSSTAYTLAQRRSRDARRVTDMKAVQAAFEQYAADHNGLYPSVITDVTTAYLPSGMPSDPKPNQTTYVYTARLTPGDASLKYCVCAALEMTTGGNSSTNGCVFVSSSPYYCVRDVQ